MVGSSEWEVSVMIEQTITIGNIIEIASILGGGLIVFVTLKSTVSNISDKVDGMQEEIKKLGEVLIAQGRFDEKLAGLDRRVSGHDRQLDELRHGDGFVRGRQGIDREYP